MARSLTREKIKFKGELISNVTIRMKEYRKFIRHRLDGEILVVVGHFNHGWYIVAIPKTKKPGHRKRLKKKLFRKFFLRA